MPPAVPIQLRGQSSTYNESVWTRIRSLHIERLSAGPYCFAVYTQIKYLSVHFHVVCISMYIVILLHSALLGGGNKVSIYLYGSELLSNNALFGGQL